MYALGSLILCCQYKPKPTQKNITETQISHKHLIAQPNQNWKIRGTIWILHMLPLLHIVLTIHPIMRTPGTLLGFFYGNSNFLKYCSDVLAEQIGQNDYLTSYEVLICIIIYFFTFCSCSLLSPLAFKACTGDSWSDGPTGGDSSVRRIRDGLLSLRSEVQRTHKVLVQRKGIWAVHHCGENAQAAAE